MTKISSAKQAPELKKDAKTVRKKKQRHSTAPTKKRSLASILCGRPQSDVEGLLYDLLAIGSFLGNILILIKAFGFEEMDPAIATTLDSIFWFLFLYFQERAGWRRDCMSTARGRGFCRCCCSGDGE